ncbi:MAG: acyltransferase [Gammaproteobacteria bacterium]|nr:acyltransferase [Gammaproteobacteria bacterium]
MSFAPSARTSSAVTIIRPLLIGCIMLAHLFAMDSEGVLNAAAALNFDDWLTVFLKSTLAKSGVPLLSLVSGYLAVRSLRQYGYPRLLGRKARRLVWPLLWANLLFILLIGYPQQAADPTYRPDLQLHPVNAFGWLQASFAFYRLPANQPLFFLKDLFTCFLLLPLLLAVAKVRVVNFLVLPWMAWKCITLDAVFLFPVYPLWFMRFDIVFAFYIGILLYLHERDLIIRDERLGAALVVLFLVVCAAVSALYVVWEKTQHVTLFLSLDFTVKTVSVVGCIALMSRLSRSENPATGALKRLSPFAYSMFLTHAISYTLFHQAWMTWLDPPVFFGASGVSYILAIFAVGIGAAVGLRLAWGAAISRVSARA